MRQRMRASIDECLEASEEAASCYAARTQPMRKRLQRAVGEGYVVEPAPSIYARSAYWHDLKPANRMCHVMRGLQKLHPDWIFAGPSAAVAWGFAVSNRYLEKVWVATTRRAHGRQLGYRRDIIVSHDEPLERGGLRLTSWGRTVGDCLRIMGFRAGLAIADSALHVAESLDVDLHTGADLQEELERACPRMTGIRRMRALTAMADGRAESGGESVARATMLELGLASPDLQEVFHSPLAPGRDYRVDFSWSVRGSDSRIVGELDGFEKYENPMMTSGRSVAQIIGDEHRRQTHIEACPNVLRFVRFGFADVLRERAFLELLLGCGVPRDYRMDALVQAAGGQLRCRE